MRSAIHILMIYVLYDFTIRILFVKHQIRRSLIGHECSRMINIFFDMLPNGIV